MKSINIKNRNSENAQATYQRVNIVLGADKAVMSEECKAVALRDFSRLAQEYFDLKTPLQLEITNNEGEYSVSITFKADRVKTFFLLQ